MTTTTTQDTSNEKCKTKCAENKYMIYIIKFAGICNNFTWLATFAIFVDNDPHEVSLGERPATKMVNTDVKVILLYDTIGASLLLQYV